MEYDKIIIDMLNRICTLEEKVENLINCKEISITKIGKNDIVQYIAELKEKSKKAGLVEIELVANDIHKQLKLTSKMPSVCNAMRYSMKEGDEILFKTPSGNSSTFKVKYYL